MKKTKKAKQQKLYIVYDERAIGGNTDDAAVMVSCDSLEEAESWAGEFGLNAAVYSYDIKGRLLINEKFECII